MEAQAWIALVALVISAGLSGWAALSASRSATNAGRAADVAEQAIAVSRTQAALMQVSVENELSARDRADRPRYRMVADSEPDGEAWGITISMYDGPTRVEARWLYQGETAGPWEDAGHGSPNRVREVRQTMAKGNGSFYLHKDGAFRLFVQCLNGASWLDVTVKVASVELSVDGDDEPTGRHWTESQDVRQVRGEGEAFSEASLVTGRRT